MLDTSLDANGEEVVALLKAIFFGVPLNRTCVCGIGIYRANILSLSQVSPIHPIIYICYNVIEDVCLVDSVHTKCQAHHQTAGDCDTM